MSLEEPAEVRGNGGDSSAPPERNTPTNPRLMAGLMVLWIVQALFWIVTTLQHFSEGDRDYFRLVLGVLSLGLAVTYLVMWRRSKARRRNQP